MADVVALSIDINVIGWECDEEYIGETARTFGERYKEHLKAPSPIYDHYNISGHNITLNNFSIVGREEQNLSRLIKESMFIRVNNPFLNKEHRHIPSASYLGWGSNQQHRTKIEIMTQWL